MSEQELILRTLEKLGEATATIARLTSELAEARAERDRALPFEAALRARHNSFDPAYRKEFGIEREPTPLEGIDQLVDEAEDLVRRECKILMDEQSAERAGLRKRLASAIEKLETIVVPDGVDAGVIWLSQESPTHYDAELKGQVYEHENFSPLGDALVELHQILAAARREQSATVKGETAT